MNSKKQLQYKLKPIFIYHIIELFDELFSYNKG